MSLRLLWINDQFIGRGGDIIENKYPYGKIPGIENPAELFSLKGRKGLVVGGAGNMAKQFIKTLGLAGAAVVVADLPEADPHQTAERLTAKTGADIKGHVCDTTEEMQIDNLFEEYIRIHNRIDFLIYGVMAKPPGYYRPTDQYAVKTWQQVMEGNLQGAFMTCRKAALHMGGVHGGGSMVLISSIYGLVGPDQRIYQDCSPVHNIYGGTDPLNCPASYAASKSGLIGLSRYFATLWGRENIRVNVLTPGGVFDGQEDNFHEAYIDRTPLGRMGVWSDFNGAVLFLVSDASRYMTGANIVVDGGWTAW